MKTLLTLAGFLLISVAAQAGTTCNQTIQSGTGCIHGHAVGPSREGGPIYLCYSWDTSCTSPLQYIEEFHDAGSFYDWEFLEAAGSSYNLRMVPNSYFTWTPSGVTATDTLVYNVTYYAGTYSSLCTPYGWYVYGSGTCN